MQAKDIKRLVIKQLKAKFPHWRRLTKKEKKALAEQTIIEVMADYNTEQWKYVPLHELTNMPDVPPGIIPLHEMGKYIDKLNCNLLPFTKQYHHRYLNDHDLRFIDALLDDRVLDSILATPSYHPSERKVTLAQLFRAELLKALRYGEMSYRKYCDLIINKLENKTVRSFLHLPLHKKTCIHHSQLSKFRTDLTIAQMLNLMVYAAHLLLQRIKLPHPVQIGGVDSTDLASSCGPAPLATLTVGIKRSVSTPSWTPIAARAGKRGINQNTSSATGYIRWSCLIPKTATITRCCPWSPPPTIMISFFSPSSWPLPAPWVCLSS